MLNYSNSSNSKYFYRLVALWSFCEAFAGGILHLTKIPFAGLLVSTLSVFCIILIASICGASNILKATVIVIVIKFLLSPYSPPTAYIAVLFQGLCGRLFLWNKKFISAGAVMLGIFALVESALQRLLVLMLLYGNSFWKALDVYLNKLLGNKFEYNISLTLAVIYLIIHAVAGAGAGYYGYYIFKKTEEWKNDKSLIPAMLPATEILPKKRKKKKFKLFFLYPFLIMIILAAVYSYGPEKFLESEFILKIVIRFILVIAIYLLIIKPMVMYFIKKKIASAEKSNSAEIQKALKIIPEIKSIFLAAKEQSASLSGIKRLKQILKIILVNVLRN